MKHLTILLSIVFLISCGNATDEEGVQSSTDTSEIEVVEAVDTIVKSQRAAIDSAGAFFIDSLIENDGFDPLRMPDYTKGVEGLLVLAREYHGDEVSDDMRNASWFEFYRNGERYYLQKSKLKFEKVFDGVIDEDSTSKTGVKVSGRYKDGVFMANLKALKEGEVQQITLDTNVVLPGKSLMFEYKGLRYRFYASAYYTMRKGKDRIKYVANYKMYLERDSAGIKTTQLIIANPIYDDLRDIRGFMFVGDIDNDGKPDFIMDTSNYYNGSTPTLFLSSYAKEGDLIKVVAFHSSVGC